MTINTKSDYEAVRNQASWAASHALVVVAQGQSFDWTGIAKAMFHAGEAWAYYQCGDLVEKAHAKQTKGSKANPEGGK